jgi:hypothetical protein
MGQYEHVRQSLQLNHLSTKEGSLFCFVMRSTKPGRFRLCSWCLWKAFHDIWTCGAKVFEYWMISSLKIKPNGI